MSNEIEKLTAAKCTLQIMAAGLKIKGVRVKDVAEAISAPKMFWRARSLMRWIDDKMLILA